MSPRSSSSRPRCDWTRLAPGFWGGPSVSALPPAGSAEGVVDRFHHTPTAGPNAPQRGGDHSIPPEHLAPVVVWRPGREQRESSPASKSHLSSSLGASLRCSNPSLATLRLRKIPAATPDTYVSWVTSSVQERFLLLHNVDDGRRTQSRAALAEAPGGRWNTEGCAWGQGLDKPEAVPRRSLATRATAGSASVRRRRCLRAPRRSGARCSRALCSIAACRVVACLTLSLSLLCYGVVGVVMIRGCTTSMFMVDTWPSVGRAV